MKIRVKDGMGTLYIYTLFDRDRGYPRCTGIKIGKEIQLYDLFRAGSGRTVTSVREDCAKIGEIITRANRQGHKIVISDFKAHFKHYSIPIGARHYNVYDLHLPTIPSKTQAEDIQTVRNVLEKMSQQRCRDYQMILANASVVYEDLQNSGLLLNYHQVWPIWSVKTFSGRSKSVGFNLQGYTSPEHIWTTTSTERDVLIHFDWIAADIRAAALLSGDEKLEESFRDSDPYVFMIDELTRMGSSIDRDQAKLLLLRSINSMDLEGVALSKIYSVLGRWLAKSHRQMTQPGGFSETILHRRFRSIHAKNELAMLNGTMQGSVAHGMQNVIRKVWEKSQGRIIGDIHDSLVMISSPTQPEIQATIDIVSPIMLHPFEGILPSNPAFPLKVSVGPRWKDWELRQIYRQSGVTNVKEVWATDVEETPESEITASETPTEGTVSAETASA